MKSPLYTVFIVASLLVAVAHCFPRVARQTDSSSEENGGDGIDTVLVLPGRGNPFAIPRPVFQIPDLSGLGSDDDDSIEGFNPFGFNFNPLRHNPLDGFIESMQNAMNRIREQMAGVLSGLPGPGAFSPWGKIPEGGNTTSTTKIIDGHIVTVNDTTYQSGDENGNAVFRVRIVDVKPLNQTTDGGDNTEVDIGGGEEIETVTLGPNETTDKQGEKEDTTTPARSVETVEDLAGNEIPKNQVDTLTA